MPSLKERVGKLIRGRLTASDRVIIRRPRALIEAPRSRLVIEFEDLIARRMRAGSELFFVQIGAFDGRTGDQLHEWIMRYGWSGILVEPHPRYFAELERTYADRPMLSMRNVAISNAPESRTLYAIRDGVPGLPRWAPQLASFDRAVVESRGLRGPQGEETIEEVQVQCLTLSELLQGVGRVDLLQVDVEGYDAEILRMFDFESYRPSIVRFENRHLTRADHDSAIRRLLSYGYLVDVTGPDTLGWHSERN